MQAKGILKTLAYADIFDYPLTRSEIYRWSIGPSSSTSPINHPQVQSQSSFYFLKGRRAIIKLRQQRTRWSKSKFKLAVRVGKWLKIIPTIHMVGITGALAMRNSDQHDDIDLIIVTYSHTLWLTRPFVVLLVSLIAKRRQPQTKRFNNHICLNLWLDTTALAVPRLQRNLYTAHEVAQVELLWDRHHTYPQFLSQNRWLNQYLPHIPIPKSISEVAAWTPRMVSWLNRLVFCLQVWYMKSRRTTERVSLHAAFFHPRDTAGQVLASYHDSNRLFR